MTFGDKLVELSSLASGSAKQLFANIEIGGGSFNSLGAEVIYVNTSFTNLGIESMMGDVVVDMVDAVFDRVESDADIELIEFSADIVSEEE